MKKTSDFRLLPGDRIVIPKSGLRLVQHHALYLGQNYQGLHLIVENKIGHGVRLVTTDEFFRGVTEITRIETFKGSNYERKIAIQEALDKLGQPYDLINYNCQHFANEIQHGIVISNQVENFLSGFKAIAGVFLFFALVKSIINN